MSKTIQDPLYTITHEEFQDLIASLFMIQIVRLNKERIYLVWQRQGNRRRLGG